MPMWEVSIYLVVITDFLQIISFLAYSPKRYSLQHHQMLQQYNSFILTAYKLLQLVRVLLQSVTLSILILS